MVYPSNAEGYGLPILEGLAMGLPVIASDIAPHRQFSEIGGIVYFDPTSVTSLKLAMEFVANPENNWNLRSSIRFERIPADPSSWARETRLVLEAKEPKLPCSAPSPCSD
jgi:glycosyltransferase involved in cell wall biosynthesis